MKPAPSFSCYLKKANRGVLEAALSFVQPGAGQKPKIIKAGELLLNSCWVAGDPEIKERDDLLVAACFEAYELIEIKKARLEKRSPTR